MEAIAEKFTINTKENLVGQDNLSYWNETGNLENPTLSHQL